MVRNRRYALDRDALPWIMKGVRCSHVMRQCVILMVALWWRWLVGCRGVGAEHAEGAQGFSARDPCKCKQAARP